MNTEPTLNDWKDHLSTLFPQVRLKQFLEIRSMDACSWDLICSQPAFWTGLLYDENSLNKTQEIVEGWSQDDRDYLYKNTPKEGLSCRFKEGTVLNVAQNLFEISKEGLERRNILNDKKQYNETYYLKDLEKNLSNNQSPADVLINNFNNHWNKDINNIYSENIF